MNSHALHKLSYGLYVLTTEVKEIPFGCIVNTVFQITSTPPQIAVSCNNDNYTCRKIKESQKFGISVLAEDTLPNLIQTFGYQSGQDINKFSKHPYQKGAKLSLPLFSEVAVATFECKVVKAVEVDTHTIFIGEVVDCNINRKDADEMTYRYYHETRKGSAPKNAPTYIPEKNEEDNAMWKCSICGHIYNDKLPFEQLADDWKCPICGQNKSVFKQ